MKVYLFPEKVDELCMNRFGDVPDLLQTAPENSKGQKQDFIQTQLFSSLILMP